MPGVRKSNTVKVLVNLSDSNLCYSVLHACQNHPPISQVLANPAQPTAPDAFAQVKKGLRGLFGRKKKRQDQPTPTTGAPSGSNSTAPPGAASSVPEPTKTGIYSTTDFPASNPQLSKTRS